MVALNETQILRLYMVFQFEEYERIVGAALYDDGRMIINFVDLRDGRVGRCEPYFVDDYMKEKLDFIMNGLKLERVE